MAHFHQPELTADFLEEPDGLGSAEEGERRSDAPRASMFAWVEKFGPVNIKTPPMAGV